MKTAVNSDPLDLVWAIIIFPALASSVFVVAPMLVGEMVAAHGFTNAEAGYVMSAEFGGMMLSAVTSYFWLGKFKTASAVKLSVILSSSGYILSGIVTLTSISFSELLFVRLLSGLPNGAIMVICLSAIADMRNVERGYALHTLGQVALGGVGVLLLPLLFAASGLYAAYFLMGLMMSVSWPLTKAFPTLRLPPVELSISAMFEPRNRLGILALLGLLLFYASLMGIWTYAERLGVASGIGIFMIGTILAVTTAFGFIGAAAASFMAGRASQLSMIASGMVLITATVLLFKGPHTLTSFSITISVAKFSWMFVLPFILGLVASIDHSKRLIISGYITLGIGTTLGPAIAAFRLGDSTDYNRIIISSLCLITASTLIFIFVALKARSIDGRRPIRSMRDI